MQRALIALLRVVPVPVIYSLMAPVIPFYMLFDRKGYKASYSFFRDRMEYCPLKSFLNVYANEFRLGQVVIDRFALFAGRHFDVDIEGDAFFRELASEKDGFVVLGAHVGNHEMAGYSLRSPKKMHALVFAGEKETMMLHRAESFGKTNIEMVPVSRDLSHIFSLNAALDGGGVAIMPADRLFGSPKELRCKFFGGQAAFPLGPFALTCGKGVAALAMFVVKTGVRSYKALIRPLANPSGDAGGLALAYCSELEAVVRQHPTQWFNFYDFWK